MMEKNSVNLKILFSSLQILINVHVLNKIDDRKNFFLSFFFLIKFEINKSKEFK